MKKLINMVHFYAVILVRSSKIVMHLATLIFLQSIVYMTISQRPRDFLSSVFLAEIFTFIIAIWLGFSSNSWIDETTEQVLILRVKKDKIYYTIYVVFLFIVCIFISLISASIPVIIHLADNDFFNQYTLSYFINSFLLMLGSSFSGIALGALFHPRLTLRKKDDPLVVVFFGVVAITRTSIVDWQGLLRYVLWIFPSVSTHSSLITESTFTFSLVAKLSLISVFYGVCYSFIKIVRLSKEKF